MTDTLIDGGQQTAQTAPVPTPNPAGAVRARLADRAQVGMHFCCVDELVPADHPVRVVWAVVGQMDLSKFEEPIKSREFSAGRPANDVRVMVGLWLYATVDNVAGGRHLERLCADHLAYKWLLGGLSVNYHTLNDFRVGHQNALDELFTATLGRLIFAGLVEIDRISQDGLRVRAGAGSASFKRRPTLEKCLAEAEAHLADLNKLRDQEAGQEQTRRQAAEAAAAQDRVERVKAALSEMTKAEAAKAKQTNKKKRDKEPRISTTDPEARVMKMPNGGFNPAYNVQLGTDPVSRAIVGVTVSNCGGDAPLSEPMRQQVETRTGQKVEQHLIDGGYVNLDVIDRAADQNVELFMPVPEPNKNAKQQNRFDRRPTDTDAVAEWRRRMNTEAAEQIYKQRASTSETVNADLRTYRGMSPFKVRGIAKATCVALWSALAYNILHFAPVLT
jgi:transposase